MIPRKGDCNLCIRGTPQQTGKVMTTKDVYIYIYINGIQQSGFKFKVTGSTYSSRLTQNLFYVIVGECNMEK